MAQPVTQPRKSRLPWIFVLVGIAVLGFLQLNTMD